MVKKCDIDSVSLARMEKYPGLAAENVKYGVYTQAQVNACRPDADEPSAFDKVKGFAMDAFAQAKAAIEPLDVKKIPGQVVEAGAGLAVEGVTQNSGSLGNAARALQDRGKQLSSMDM